MFNLNESLAVIGPTDTCLLAIVLFLSAALFIYMARSSDEPMNHATYVATFIGAFVGLYLLMVILNFLGSSEGIGGVGEHPVLSSHAVMVAIVVMGAAFVVAWGVFFASIGTSLMISAIAVQGGFGLFAATVNILVWTMAASGRYEPFADVLAAIWEFSRYLVFFTGAASLALGGIAGMLSLYRIVKAKKVVHRHQLVHQ